VEEFFTNIENLKSLFVAEVLAAVPVALGLAWKFIKGKLGPDRMETLTSIARVAVFASEELGHKGGKVGDAITGAEKLGFATAKVRELAAKAGIKVSVADAEAFIEAVLNEVRPFQGVPDLDAFNLGAEKSDGPAVAVTSLGKRPIYDNPQA